MSYNTSMDTITVGDITYDVERHSTDLGYRFTLSLDGEDVFEGLEGYCENEAYIEEHDNPRDWSNVGVMAVSYRGHNLGDEDLKSIDFEIECDDCNGTGEVDVPVPDTCQACKGEGYFLLNPVDYFKRERGARVVLGLTVYEHSGITMRVGDVTLPWDTQRWDTSFVGFTFDTPEKVKECIGDDATDEQIEAALRGEVEVYASYLEGDVTWYRVEDDETNYQEACGGFVGDHEECERECFSSMESAIVKRLVEIKEREEWANRDVETT